MKHNLKTFPHREDSGKDFLESKSAKEWVDSNVRCPEYHRWLTKFERELKEMLNQKATTILGRMHQETRHGLILEILGEKP